MSVTAGGGVDGLLSGPETFSALSGEAGKKDVISGWEGEEVRRVLLDLGVACDDSDERLTLFENSTSRFGTGTGFLNNSSYDKIY